MPQSAAGRFTDAEDYMTSLPIPMTSLVITEPGTFNAQMTWAKLPNVHLLRAQETLARVGYISLPMEWIHVSFLSPPGPGLVWNGVELPPDHLVFHTPGERLHQRLTGATQWGTLSVKLSFFRRYGSALAGRDLEAPTVPGIVRPLTGDSAGLLRLHARVAHVIETKPVTIVDPDVGHGLEHDFLHAVVTCLTGGETRNPSRATGHRAAIMGRLEAVLAECPDRPIPISELCARVNASERMLRTCCIEVLGIGPSVYMRLRRLKLVRAAMLRGDPAITQAGEIARRFGFREMGRFAAAYRTAFGEPPSATMRRTRNLSSKSGLSESA